MIISYLAQKSSNGKIQYLNLVQKPPYQIRDSYSANCAPCHGLNGDGTGFNREYLPTEPGNFTDGELMGQRSDDTLFDTIHIGGRMMNKKSFNARVGRKIESQGNCKLCRKNQKFL